MRKKVVSILLTLIMVIASSAIAFADIDYSQWNSQSSYPSDVVNTTLFSPVKFLMDKKIVQGYEDGLFHAEKNITRAEYAKMMVVATNNTNNVTLYENKDIFTDLSGASWAKGYINTAYSVNLIQGMGDSKFAPGENVTYAQAIAILIRSKGITDSQMSAYGQWPDNYIQYANMYNMVGSVTIKDWNAAATRGDIAMILYRNLPK